ncbi:uncharacterized protein BDR25DRAFT_309670 [Lindgomyces ingoldianus]|uniref:Uncharacterized protein n=1 Tax=Lindgomyces ingoldianus TaxID=673940 RepID=A0ACB6RBZ3_9PLEO|nr:uncharacterized protein BDR25DRAFT_309670 [Lindgomyces ingoldianus]KAF2476245.1 hypothetical protein BDR25DRAFT_309670 [Lindgomyces ingoldianus]
MWWQEKASGEKLGPVVPSSSNALHAITASDVCDENVTMLIKRLSSQRKGCERRMLCDFDITLIPPCCVGQRRMAAAAEQAEMLLAGRARAEMGCTDDRHVQRRDKLQTEEHWTYARYTEELLLRLERRPIAICEAASSVLEGLFEVGSAEDAIESVQW